MSRAAEPVLHALLVGVDKYLPNDLPDGVFYPCLEACVADVEAMESYLLRGLGVPGERIEKLTASEVLLPEPPEPPERRPTYANLTAALFRLEERARPGEQALVHYSGHGGRAPTHLPKEKGERGLDECLVPYDIRDPETQYLRDVEIDAWLRRMRERGVFVTLVLDCCHSGGATRTGDRWWRARGVDEVDCTVRPALSRLASREEMVAAWREGGDVQVAWDAVPRTRAAWNGSGAGALRHARLPEGRRRLHPRGYAALAACRPCEKAMELPFDGRLSGALTHYLLEALRQVGPRPTYEHLRQVLVARIHGRIRSQTPLLEGEGGRPVFGRSELPVRWAVEVLEGSTGELVRLNTGLAQGVGEGARFAVYPMAAPAGGDPEALLATVEVERAGGTVSRARVVERRGQKVPGPGDQARLRGPASPARRRGVRLVEPAGRPGALAWLRRALEGERVLAAVGPGEGADFEVAVGAGGELEIRDGEGRPFAHLGAPLPADRPSSARTLAARLAHLARYRDLLELVPPPESTLSGGLHLRLEGAARRGSGDIWEATTGQEVKLGVTNASPDEVNVVVLDFQPDWGVSQVFPSPSGGLFHPLDPGAPVMVPLQVDLPPGIEQGTDVLKVFATTGPVSYRWLEMPALAEQCWDGDERQETPAVEEIPPRPAPAAEEVAGREGADGWAVAEVEVRVVRQATLGEG